MNRVPSLLLCALPMMAALPAQTGPWTDGELIVRTTVNQQLTLLRIAPETGDAEPLCQPLYWGGWAGSMAFDSYRNGLIANCSLPPDNPFLYKLWLIDHSGNATPIPSFPAGTSLRAMCATGDGRVYYQPHTGFGGAPTEIRWLDAANGVHTLLDQAGAAPFVSPALEHTLYHAPTNSLIGCSSAWWSGSICTPGEGSVVRIPLSADGSRVAGPTLCSSTGTVQEHFTGFGSMPGGSILLTMGTSYLGQHRMKRVDPVTLAITNWADPQPADLEGGVFSSRIGAAITLDAAGPTATLRRYGQGGSGFGTTIPTDIQLAPSGGYSPVESMLQVDTNGPCNGFVLQYGQGLAGTQGHVPSLGVAGCPEIGTNFTFAVDQALGGSVGVMVIGLASTSIPLLGGTYYIDSVLGSVWFVCTGQAGIGGIGTGGVPLLVNDPAFVGLNLHAQAGVLDAAAVQGFALTNAVHVVIG